MLLVVHQNFLNLYVLEISFEKSNFFLLELLCDDNIQLRTKVKKHTHKTSWQGGTAQNRHLLQILK